MPRDGVHHYSRRRQSGKAIASTICSLAGLVDRRLNRAAMRLLVPTLMLWIASGASAMEQIGPRHGNGIGLPRIGGQSLIDDTHVGRPRGPEPPPRGPRFQIVTAGPHVILLDTFLGNTWLLRPGEPGTNGAPEWIFIFREILDDQRRPAAPPRGDTPAADQDTEEGDFDPFGP